MTGARRARSRPRLVTVVIPVRNGAATLADELDALSRQTYGGAWEVLVSDNGSTDATPDVAERWRDRLPLRVVDASGSVGVAHARNRGIEEARGDLVCFCDADDVVVEQWLEELVAAAASADLVAGALDVDTLTAEHARSWRPRPAASLGTAPPFAPGGNCAVWRDVFDEIGGFEEFGYGEDLEFSARAIEAGFRLGWAPGAVIRYRLPSSLPALARQNLRIGKAEARLDRQLRGRGRGSMITRALRLLAWILVRLPYLLTGRRGMWVREAALLAGYSTELLRPSPVTGEGEAIAPTTASGAQSDDSASTVEATTNTSGRPTVSILFLTYNQARFVAESLPTVVGQTFTDWELLVVDDGSTDGALEVATDWLEARGIDHVVVAHERNQGLCRSLNDALAVASGRYVAMIAADDWWEPDKLADQVALLDANPEAAVAYSDVYMNDAEGRRLPVERWGTKPLTGDVFLHVLAGGPIAPVASLIRRSALDAVGHYDESLYFEDWDMWLRLADRFPFVYSDQVSASYRVQPTSMSSGTGGRALMLESSVALLEKWTGRDRRTDEVAARSLARIGWKLYALDRRAGSVQLRRACRLFPSRQRGVQALWGTFSLPPEWLERRPGVRRTSRARAGSGS